MGFSLSLSNYCGCCNFSSDILSNYCLIHFSDLLFSMETFTVLKSLETVVPEWYRLGLALGLPEATLSTIEHDHHRSVETCKRKMVQKWLHFPRLNPSWCSLVKALQAIGLNAAAVKISKEHCKSRTWSQGSWYR